MASTGSSSLKFTVSAPKERARSSRSAWPSTAITRPAPIWKAEMIAKSPTGPQPQTATTSPSSISAMWAPKYPVG